MTHIKKLKWQNLWSWMRKNRCTKQTNSTFNLIECPLTCCPLVKGTQSLFSLTYTCLCFTHTRYKKWSWKFTAKPSGRIARHQTSTNVQHLKINEEEIGKSKTERNRVAQFSSSHWFFTFVSLCSFPVNHTWTCIINRFGCKQWGQRGQHSQMISLQIKHNLWHNFNSDNNGLAIMKYKYWYKKV